jgi:hypothetical protein
MTEEFDGRASHLGVAGRPPRKRRRDEKAGPMTGAKPDEYWAMMARQLIQVEMKRARMTYKGLANQLEKLGIHETERSLVNKVNRGTFSMAFGLQVLSALGLEQLVIDFEPDHEG